MSKLFANVIKQRLLGPTESSTSHRNNPTGDLTDNIGVGRFVGAGTFGHVLMGRWKDPNGPLARKIPNVALKVIRLPELKGRKLGAERIKKINNLLRSWNRTDHDNILPLLGATFFNNWDDNSFALVSPWMVHGNVMDFLQRNTSFPAAGFLLDIIEGLYHLHTLDPPIIHGDIKAANVLINGRMQACLCDFGFHHGEINDVVRWRGLALLQENGIQRWMAPELLDGQVAGPTMASDIYAYAMTCYEILSGAVPFDFVPTGFGVAAHVLGGRRPEPSTGEMWPIITQCWAQQADIRPTTASVLGSIRGLTEIASREPRGTCDGRNMENSDSETVTNSRHFFRDLPTVMALEILEYLDMYSLLTCRLVCSAFCSLVDSSPSLQYKIELGLAGQQDGARNEWFVRRQLLKTHQEKWAGLKWTGELPLPESSPGFWELCGGVFGQGSGSPPSIHFKRLPSQSRGIEERDWTVVPKDIRADDFSIDPGQDLLVIVEAPRWQQNEKGFNIHLRALSTGDPHPLALGSCVLIHELEALRQATFYYLEIYHDVLGILFYGETHGIDDVVIIWNWRTGQIVAHITSNEISSMTFLSERYAIFAVLCESTAQMEVMEPCLLVVDVLSMATTEPRALRYLGNTFSFYFPSFANFITIRNFFVRSNPRPTQQPEQVPFSTAHDNRLCVTYFRINGDSRALCFVAFASSFLSLVEIAARCNMKRFKWYMWVPDNCRIIRNIYYSNIWFLAMYGTKLLAKRSPGRRTYVDVYDFNQLALRKQEKDCGMNQEWHDTDERANEGLKCVSTPARFAAGEIFKDGVETRLGYRLTSWEVPKELMSCSPMCSEDGIVLVGDGYHILTV